MLLSASKCYNDGSITRLRRDTASGTQPLYSSGLLCARVSRRLIAAVTTPCTDEYILQQKVENYK